MLTIVLLAVAWQAGLFAAKPKVLVAHRGASAYAPEHTLAAYRLALDQGADYVEQDLAVTKDGVLICLHDDGLERTTNVEEVFPDRWTTDSRSGAKTWRAADFTLAEISRLDAGSWFDARFAGARVPTWEEAIDLILFNSNGRAGLYPELKSPSLYRTLGVDMVGLVAASIKQHKLDQPTAGQPALVLQSFDALALQEFARVVPGVPRVLLIDPRAADRWLNDAGFKEIAGFASGIGPDKSLLANRPDLVKLAHDAGLDVTPYTFRSRATGTFSDVNAELSYFLFELGVDGAFTDNPDQFPRQ